MNYRGMVAVSTLLAVPFVGQSPAAPPPESAANQRMHEMSFDHLVARFEDPARKKWQKPDEIIAGLGPLAGETVADIGAGTGYFSFPIAQQGGKGHCDRYRPAVPRLHRAAKTERETKRRSRNSPDGA